MINTESINDIINDIMEPMVGDTPVSVQIETAINRTANKEHAHDEYALRDDVENLKKKIDILIDLVGDAPVSEQIYMAIKNLK